MIKNSLKCIQSYRQLTKLLANKLKTEVKKLGPFCSHSVIYLTLLFLRETWKEDQGEIIVPVDDIFHGRWVLLVLLSEFNYQMRAWVICNDTYACTARRDLELSGKGANKILRLQKVFATDRSWSIHDDTNVHCVLTRWGSSVWVTSIKYTHILKVQEVMPMSRAPPTNYPRKT